jgi:aconitase B
LYGTQRRFEDFISNKNIDEQYGKVEFKARLVAPPTYNIVDELKAEGDWEVLQNTLIRI